MSAEESLSDILLFTFYIFRCRCNICILITICITLVIRWCLLGLILLEILRCSHIILLLLLFLRLLSIILGRCSHETSSLCYLLTLSLVMMSIRAESTAC